MIKFAKPQLHPDAYKNVNEVMESGVFVHGKFSRLFEEKFKEKFRYENATTVSNATTGLQLSHFLLGRNIDPQKNEVLCPAMSHVATAHAIEMLGLKPIFVDANLSDGNIDVSKLEGVNLERVRGMTYVHFNGFPADVKTLTSFCKDNGLYSVEDCAISLGASVESIPVGLWGDIGAFSFHPVKQLTTGEGGMVVSKYDEHITKISRIKAFGVDQGFNERKIPGVYNVDSVGTNNRMAELPAAIGYGQLNSIEQDLKIREKNFNILKNLLANENLPLKILGENSKDSKGVYNLIVLIDERARKDRNGVILALKSLGLECSVYYPHPIPRFKYYQDRYGYDKQNFKNSTIIADTSFTIPLGPHLKDDDLSKIVDFLKKVF